MKKIVIIVLAITTSLSAYGQFQDIEWKWNDTSLDRQIRFWPNGSTKIENKLIKGQLFRFQYYENGDLELMSVIRQYREIDTVIAYDPETMQGHIDTIVKSFGDAPDGDYQVYFNGGKPRILGTYQNYTLIGTRTEYWGNGNTKSITNYNSRGKNRENTKSIMKMDI